MMPQGCWCVAILVILQPVRGGFFLVFHSIPFSSLATDLPDLVTMQSICLFLTVGEDAKKGGRDARRMEGMEG